MSLDARLDATVDDGHVTFTYSVENRGVDPVTLTFSDAGRVDVTVEDDGVVWRSTDGRLFAQVMGERTIAPGERATYEVTWENARSGTYSAVGDLRARSQSVPAETTVTV